MESPCTVVKSSGNITPDIFEAGNNFSGGTIYGIPEIVGEERRGAKKRRAGPYERRMRHRFLNFETCVRARNLDYMNFSTRVGVSDDVTKHD